MFKNRRQTWDSQHWPTAEAQVVSSRVDLFSAGSSGAVFQLEATFRYEVTGTVHFGHYAEKFRDLSEAQQIERSLTNGPLFARYNPADPAESVLNPYRDVRPEN